jgi:uncharacterized RDD family membrane protein YckC
MSAHPADPVITAVAGPRLRLAGPMAEERDRNLQPGPEPLAARVIGQGARGARNLADAAGLGQALDAAAEESIVRAVESPALERALIRLAEEGRLEEVLTRTAAHADLEGLVLEAIDSDAADRVWERILASDKAQMLVERVAEAPEVRAAIAQQGVGLIGDIGRQVRRLTRPLDNVLERIVRALLRRPKREGVTNAAGLVTRALAAAIDIGLLFVGFSLAAGLLAAILNFIFGSEEGGLGTVGVLVAVLVILSISAWIVASFWALAGQTPGMRFLAIRLDRDGERRIGARAAFKRLFALPLAVLPLGLGLFAILVSDRRRGWQDAVADTDVLYEADERAPWAGPG